MGVRKVEVEVFSLQSFTVVEVIYKVQSDG